MSDHEFSHRQSEFFHKYQVRIAADTKEQVYHVRRQPRSVEKVPWPTRPMDQLLGEALGPDHIIQTKDHPMITEFLAEEEVE